MSEKNKIICSETITIPKTDAALNADFAITIKGGGFEPVYYDGDIILIKNQDSVCNGEIGAFFINGELCIKKHCGDRLVSFNPTYEDIYFSYGDEIECIGKVIGRV